mmetsp:Transcript_19222/g.29468  ORF Transcript_19222/g.29468 Transcript_19222/m.29468 type:complete len:245 (-) Transcript_19222:471-1205(-)
MAKQGIASAPPCATCPTLHRWGNCAAVLVPQSTCHGPRPSTQVPEGGPTRVSVSQITSDSPHVDTRYAHYPRRHHDGRTECLRHVPGREKNGPRGQGGAPEADQDGGPQDRPAPVRRTRCSCAREKRSVYVADAAQRAWEGHGKFVEEIRRAGPCRRGKVSTRPCPVAAAHADVQVCRSAAPLRPHRTPDVTGARRAALLVVEGAPDGPIQNVLVRSSVGRERFRPLPVTPTLPAAFAFFHLLR